MVVVQSSMDEDDDNTTLGDEKENFGIGNEIIITQAKKGKKWRKFYLYLNR